VPLHHCIPAILNHCTTAILYHRTTAPLYPCNTESLFHRNTVPLHNWPLHHFTLHHCAGALYYPFLDVQFSQPLQRTHCTSHTPSMAETANTGTILIFVTLQTQHLAHQLYNTHCTVRNLRFSLLSERFAAVIKNIRGSFTNKYIFLKTISTK